MLINILYAATIELSFENLYYYSSAQFDREEVEILKFIAIVNLLYTVTIELNFRDLYSGSTQFKRGEVKNLESLARWVMCYVQRMCS